MTEIKDIFANKLREEMKTYGHTTRSMEAYTAIPEHRFEEFLNQVALPNREEIKRIAKVIHVEDAILRVAVENSDPLAGKEESLELIIAKAKNKAKADRIAQGKPLIAPTVETKSKAKPKQPTKKTAKIKASAKIKKTGPGRLTEREAELFKNRFVDSLKQPNAKEFRKALDITDFSLHNYRHGKQTPLRKRALVMMAIMDKFNPITVNVDVVRLEFRTALGNAIDRAGSVNKVAAYLGKSHQIVNKWYTGKTFPTATNMIEMTSRLNKFRREDDATDQALYVATTGKEERNALVIKPAPKLESNISNEPEFEINYKDKLIADKGTPRLRTVERKKFMACLNHVESVTSKKFLAHLIGKNRVNRFHDMSRTIGRPEATEILKSIQPIAKSKGLKVTRKAALLQGTYKTNTFDVIYKPSKVMPTQPKIQIRIPVAQPKLDELGGKVLSVLDYHGDRRPLKEWLDELNAPIEDLAVIYNLEFIINNNALETRTVTISGLGNVYEYIQHTLMKSADTIDVKLTFGSCFNDPLVVHYLRYIK